MSTGALENTSAGALRKSRARLKKGSAYTQQYEINTNGAWTIIDKLKAVGGK